MTKAERWFNSLRLEEQRQVVCDHYSYCVDCPLFALDDCEHITEIENFFRRGRDQIRKEL